MHDCCLNYYNNYYNNSIKVLSTFSFTIVINFSKLTHAHPDTKSKRQRSKHIQIVLVLSTPPLWLELFRLREVVFQHPRHSYWHIN